MARHLAEPATSSRRGSTTAADEDPAADKAPAAEEDTATDTAPEAGDAKEPGIGHYIGIALSVGLFGLVVGLAAILLVVPKLSGSIPLTILTSSMEPTLPPGTLIVVQPVDVDDIVIGDVLTYQIRSGEPDVITHRVIGITETSGGERTFELQGDNNSDPDSEPVIEEQVQGRLWYAVPYVGHVNTSVNGDNRAVIIPVLAVGLLGYATFSIIVGVRSSIVARRAREAA